MSIYGRLPSELDPKIALGLAANIPMIEAKRTLVLVKAIALAFGDESTARFVYKNAIGDDVLVGRLLANMQHQKAVSSCR